MPELWEGEQDPGHFHIHSRVSGAVIVALSHTSNGVYNVPTVCQVLCWGLTFCTQQLNVE